MPDWTLKWKTQRLKAISNLRRNSEVHQCAVGALAGNLGNQAWEWLPLLSTTGSVPTNSQGSSSTAPLADRLLLAPQGSARVDD